MLARGRRSAPAPRRLSAPDSRGPHGPGACPPAAQDACPAPVPDAVGRQPQTAADLTTRSAMKIQLATGLVMEYEDAGSGPPLVLLHAFPLSREMWRPQIEA